MDGIGYLGIFIALVGLLFGAWSLWAQRRARAQTEAAKSWSRTQGRILASGIEQREGGSGRSYYVYFVPKVAYAYTAGGQERQGSRLRFGLPTFRSPSGAEAALAPYPKGAEVEVRYDPDAPDESVLDAATVGSNLKWGIVISVLVFLMGAGIVAMAVGGVFSADLDGRWAARFSSDGIDYSGEIVFDHREGTLTVEYAGSEGRKVAREHCSAQRDEQDVHIRCRDPQVVEGSGTYSADNFDLTFAGAEVMRGNLATLEGAVAGTAEFVRR